MLPHFQATTGYHPLPQTNDDDPEKAIAIGDVPTDKKKEPHTPIAKNALTLLAVILMLGVALAGKQAWATFAARHARCGFRAYCGHGDIAPLQQNRTYSSEVVGGYRNGLRTHYMLPSGDAIPTIALGECVFLFSMLSLSPGPLTIYVRRCLESWPRGSRECRQGMYH